MKNIVVFRKFPEGDLIALFPKDIVDSRGFINSYQTIGQHSDASPDLVNELSKVTKKEYAPLLNELKRIGYKNLEVK